MPITPTDRAWIEDNLKWLFEQFGHETFLRNELVQHVNDFFPYKLKMDDAYPLQVLMEKICTSMDIDPKHLKLHMVIDDESHSLPYAIGYYNEVIDFQRGERMFQINLKVMPSSSKESILYALTHSLTYVKLLGENRISVVEQDYHYLTDLCILFWGFGVIGANEAFAIQQGYYEQNPGISYTAVSRSGYFPLEMWAYALSRYCQLKKIEANELLPFLTKEMQQQVRKSWPEVHEQDQPWDLQEFDAGGTAVDPLGRNLLSEEAQQKFQTLDQAIQTQAFAQAWLDRARLNHKHGLLHPALQDLNYLIGTEQLKDQALLEKAQIALDMDLWQETFRQLVGLTPQARKWPETLYIEASYYWSTGKMEEAEVLLKQALTEMPMHAKANWSMGTVMFWRKEWDAALDYYNAAIKADPLHPLFWTYRAKVHMLQQNLQAASEDIHTALGLNKSLAEAYVGRGVLRRKEKRYDAALQDFNTALRLEYDHVYAEWHRSVIAYLVTEELWVPVGGFEALADAIEYRQQLNKLGIKHRFRDPDHTNFTASTFLNKWLYVREDRVEEALDILTEGWW